MEKPKKGKYDTDMKTKAFQKGDNEYGKKE